MSALITNLMAIDLLSLSLKAAALAGLGLLVVRSMRGQTASMRFAVLICSLAAILLLPVLSLTVPQWRVLPNVVMTHEQPAPVQNAQREVANVAPADSGSVVSVAVPRPRSAITESTFNLAWPEVLLLIWSSGVALLLVRMLLATRRLRLLLRQSMSLTDASWQSLLLQARKKLQLQRQVELRLHPDSIMPMTCGYRNPVILLPLEAESWAPARREDVLLHELAHIQRNDLAYAWISQAACALHWFNPLVWSARRALSIERERACDDMVLSAGADPSRYANCLLQTSADFHAAPVEVPCMARRSDLETRMVSILDRECQRGTVSRVALGAIVVASLATALLFSALARDTTTADARAAQVTVPDTATQVPASDELKPEATTTLAPRVQEPESGDANAQIDYFDRYDSDSELFEQLAVLDNDPSDGLTLYDLLEALRSDSPVNRAAAARVLGNYRDPQAISALVNALGDASDHVREWAARSLGNVGDETALSALAVALNDGEGEVAEWAARSLGNLGYAEAVDALVQSLTHPNYAVREWSARSLGNIGDARAVDSLIGTLQDTDGEVRQWALRALGDIGDRRAIDAIAALADDPDPEIREWSARTVYQLRQPENR